MYSFGTVCEKWNVPIPTCFASTRTKHFWLHCVPLRRYVAKFRLLSDRLRIRICWEATQKKLILLSSGILFQKINDELLTCYQRYIQKIESKRFQKIAQSFLCPIHIRKCPVFASNWKIRLWVFFPFLSQLVYLVTLQLLTRVSDY